MRKIKELDFPELLGKVQEDVLFKNKEFAEMMLKTDELLKKVAKKLPRRHRKILFELVEVSDKMIAFAQCIFFNEGYDEGYKDAEDSMEALIIKKIERLQKTTDKALK